MEDILLQIQQLSNEAAEKPTEEQISKLRGLIDQLFAEMPTTPYFKEIFRESVIDVLKHGLGSALFMSILMLIDTESMTTLKKCSAKERNIYLFQSKHLNFQDDQKHLYIAWGEEYLDWYKCEDEEVRGRISELQKTMA